MKAIYGADLDIWRWALAETEELGRHLQQQIYPQARPGNPRDTCSLPRAALRGSHCFRYIDLQIDSFELLVVWAAVGSSPSLLVSG